MQSGRVVRHGADGHIVEGEPGDAAAFVRFGVVRFAIPGVGPVEDAEAGVFSGGAVVDDVGEFEVVGVDAYADLFPSFADGAWSVGSSASRWPEGTCHCPEA